MARYFIGFGVRDSTADLGDLAEWTVATGVGTKAFHATAGSYLNIRPNGTHAETVYILTKNPGVTNNYVEYVSRAGGQSGSDTSFPLAIACDAAGNNAVVARHYGGNLQVYHYVSGSLGTAIYDSALTFATGDKLRITITGTTWQVSKNGVDVSGATDTVPVALQSNTRVGMFLRNTFGSDISSDIDAWQSDEGNAVTDWLDTVDTGKTLTTGLQRLVIPLQAGGVGEIANSSTVTAVGTPTTGTQDGWPISESDAFTGEGYDITGNPGITGDYTFIVRTEHTDTTTSFDHMWSGFPAWAITTNASSNPAFRTSGSGYVEFYASAPTLNEESTYAVTRSGSSGKLFVDGFLVGTFTDAGTLGTPANSNYGYHKYAGSSSDFSSKTKQLFAAAWNVALSDADVAKLTTPSGFRDELLTDVSPPAGIPNTLGVTSSGVIGLTTITDVIGVN